MKFGGGGSIFFSVLPVSLASKDAVSPSTNVPMELLDQLQNFPVESDIIHDEIEDTVSGDIIECNRAYLSLDFIVKFIERI